MTAARLVVAVLALAAAGAFYLGPYRDGLREEEALARIAGAIAGREVTIDCPGTLASLTDASGRDGSVDFRPDGRPGDEAKLSSATCARLGLLLAGEVPRLECLEHGTLCGEEFEDVAVAVNVLSHEAWHLHGVRSESVAQCYALQTNADTAFRLGADRAEAEAIASFFLREVQPTLPADYRTAACHNGGPLDLHPERADWPS